MMLHRHVCCARMVAGLVRCAVCAPAGQGRRLSRTAVSRASGAGVGPAGCMVGHRGCTAQAGDLGALVRDPRAVGPPAAAISCARSSAARSTCFAAWWRWWPLPAWMNCLRCLRGGADGVELLGGERAVLDLGWRIARRNPRSWGAVMRSARITATSATIPIRTASTRRAACRRRGRRARPRSRARSSPAPSGRSPARAAVAGSGYRSRREPAAEQRGEERVREDPGDARAAKVPSAALVWLTPNAAMAVLNEYSTFRRAGSRAR